MAIVHARALPAHTSPIGTIDPLRRVIVVVNLIWTVENKGSEQGMVANHLIIQERAVRFFFNPQEEAIVEVDIEPSSLQPRVRTHNLTVPRNDGNITTGIAWNHTPQMLAPGERRDIRSSLSIGVDLLRGKTELDVVSILDKVPGGGVAEHRDPNLFGVSNPPDVFVPQVVGEPFVQVIDG